MPEEMRIDPLRNPSRHRVVFDELPEAASRVGSVAIRLKEIGGALRLLAGQILGEFATEARRKEHSAILAAFALGHPHLTGLQIDIAGTQLDQFGIAHTREEQQFEHDRVRELARLPDCMVERDEFHIGEEGW